jgi:hypothetical protein
MNERCRVALFDHSLFFFFVLCSDRGYVFSTLLTVACPRCSNHFTRKAYYDEMFSTIEGWDDGTRYMEKKMNIMGTQNCSYWGTYLYGKQGEGPAMIVHLDGADRKQHKQDSTNATTASLRRS